MFLQLILLGPQFQFELTLNCMNHMLNVQHFNSLLNQQEYTLNMYELLKTKTGSSISISLYPYL